MTQINSIFDIPVLTLGAADVLVNAALEKIDEHEERWIADVMQWQRY